MNIIKEAYKTDPRCQNLANPLGGQMDSNIPGTIDSKGNLLYQKDRDSARYIKLQHNYEYFDTRPDLNVISKNDGFRDKKVVSKFNTKTFKNKG